QLRGGLVDARTDIYAAGAVLYEIAAGRRPFSQLQNAELIGAILHQRAAPPSTHKPQILPGFESVVMKALEKEPHKRYQSARQFGAALESAANTNPSPVWRRRFARAAVWATAVVLTALAATLSIKDLADFFNRKKPTHAATQEFGHRRSVAVLGFRNLSGKQENAWLSTAFSEMLTTELAAGEQLRTIPGESVSQMKINLSLADAEAYTKETLSKIRENLGTDDVVLGSYLSFGDGEIRVDMRLQDASDGETIVAISERGTERHIDELAARIGSAVRTKLALPAVSAPQQLAIRATLSSKPEAVRLYTQGLERLRTFDAVGAAKIFEQAITVDPEYALAHSALSRVWSNLGYDEKAKREAKRAFELSTGLSRQDRLSVEARYHVMSRELDQAIDIYRMLWEFFPENIDYGLQLAAVQITAGKGQDALTTVAGLRKLASPAAMDSRIDLAEAEAHESLSDFVSQQQCAGRAVAHSKANGMRLLEARALLVQGRAFQNLGDIGNALQAFENAQTMYQSAGDKGGAARALNAVAGVYHIRGEASQADRVFAQAVGIFREIGDRGDLASTLSNLGLNRRAQQDDPETKRVFEESVVIARDVGDRELLAGILTNFGTFLDQREPLEARKRYEQALEIFRSMGSQQGVATTLNDIGNTLVREPNLPLAKRSFEEALGISRQIGDKRLAGFVLYNLGRLASQQGDLVQGQDRLEEALSIRRQIGDKEQVAYTLRTLASVLIDAGQPSRAERLAREAMDQFRSVKGSSAEALTEAVFADTLFAQGRIVEAQGAIKPVSRSTTNIELGERLTILIIAARIQSATGEADQAVKTLQDVIFQAAQAHLIADELEGRLVLGEIELKGHDNAGGRARLVTLEKEAAAKGFLLISRKAHAAIAHVNSAALSLLSLLAMK
ncbi:MAG TPA: tetratricopeptide repeat protein, partial [Terriglobia bacterium]|nr:tetratricopeptide repeat protein [Terriglobia bacterium]